MVAVVAAGRGGIGFKAVAQAVVIAVAVQPVGDAIAVAVALAFQYVRQAVVVVVAIAAVGDAVAVAVGVAAAQMLVAIGGVI